MDYGIYKRFAPPDWEDRLTRAHRDPRPDYPRILLSSLAQLWWTALEYSGDDFQKILAPVLILAGEKDEFIPVEEAWELTNRISGSEVAIIPGADHEAMIPHGIDHVTSFLSRLDS